jgi:hypothetical protein
MGGKEKFLGALGLAGVLAGGSEYLHQKGKELVPGLIDQATQPTSEHQERIDGGEQPPSKRATPDTKPYVVKTGKDAKDIIGDLIPGTKK